MSQEARDLRSSKYVGLSKAAALEKANALQKDIDTFKVRLQKENKKLAKNIAAWVDVAMTTSAANSDNASGPDGPDDALPELEQEQESHAAALNGAGAGGSDGAAKIN